MLYTLQLPPGVYRQGTDYQSKGRFYDSNLVRWFEGTLRPHGGWRSLVSGFPSTALTVTGKARGMYAWRDNGNDRYAAVGTHTKLFAFGSGIAGIQDITPMGIVTGFPDNNVNVGYGGGLYGVSTYGSPRSGSNVTQFATTWSMDNFGEFLVAVQSEDGRLFYWDLVTMTAEPVVALAGTTPINNKGVLVTDERFVFLLAAGGNRRRVAWSDQENLFNWEITATTQAGDFEIATNGEIMAGLKVRGQTLILTSTDAHVADYIGPPLVYGFARVGDGCGCVSRNAATVGDKAAFWMNDNGFFMYDGFVKNLPCEVADYVFQRINRGQLNKVWAVHNNDFGEVTWYYPAGMECDSYVTYNYRENHWSIGSIVRTIGVDNNVFPYPYRIDAEGMIFEHEVGFDYNNERPFAQTGPIELGEGEGVYMAKYMYPDELTQGSVEVSFATKFYPNAQTYPYGPYDTRNPTSLRFTGRQVAVLIQNRGQDQLLINQNDLLAINDEGDTLQISSLPNVGDWRVGNFRFVVEPGGMR